jgi:hypothetical protein
MSGIEWKKTTPEEMVPDIENSVKLYRENKYAFQIGLRDLDFDIQEDRLKSLGLSLPFQGISQAEEALSNHIICPIEFIEDDSTEHEVLVFDPRPIGFSGFMSCVTHSLALTNHGLFEVGRYSALSLNSPGRYWQWFLHRRLATVEEVDEWSQDHSLTSQQFMEDVYQAMING